MVDVMRQMPGFPWVPAEIVETLETHEGTATRGAVPAAELRESLGPLASDLGANDSLVSRVVQEALETSFWTNESTSWTPLGAAFDRADWGRWSADNELDELLLQQVNDEEPREATLALDDDPDLGAVLTLTIGRSWVGALAVANGGIVIPFGARDRGLRLRLSDEEVAGGDAALGRLRARGTGRGEELVLWKIYTGENSWTREATTRLRDGVTTLALHGLEGAGIAVGRIVRLVSRRLTRQRRDPLARRRLVRHERRAANIVQSVPQLAEHMESVSKALVIVHGTMSTAVRMASELDRILAGQRVPMVRFEHDTWLALETNAQELAELVARKVRGRVLLIAHSRGGLVAARAQQILARDREAGPVRLVTLGTPFCGTPLAHGTRLVNGGVSALAAGMRTMTGAAIDPVTRLASMMLRVDPIGLRVMQPDHDALPMLRDHLPPETRLVAGDCADPSHDYEGRQGFLPGVGRGTFDDEPNDLVIAVASALAGQTSGLTVASDHFSYLRNSDVERTVVSSAAWLNGDTT